MMSAPFPGFTVEQLQPISELCGGEATYRIDGWRQLIHMPSLKLLVCGVEHTSDALLCLNHNNPTYPTKLYLAGNLGAGLNWHESAYILDQSWFTFSWRDVHANQTPFEILAGHLAPLSKGLVA